MLNRLLVSVFIFIASTSIAVSDDDSETARRLSQHGDILSLEAILSQLPDSENSRVIEVELEKENQRYIYEIELLDSRGIVTEYKIDARSGDILQREIE